MPTVFRVGLANRGGHGYSRGWARPPYRTTETECELTVVYY